MGFQELTDEQWAFIAPLLWGGPRLNRTSVGLKQFSDVVSEFRDAGLNRTSVGLKHALRTEITSESTASIEPAWD